MTSVDIKEGIRKGLVLSKVLHFCKTGWPAKKLGDLELTPYVRRRDELSLQNGCALWGSRVVVSSRLRSILFGELHTGHFGFSHMKELAHIYLWWPNLDHNL